MAEQPNSPEHGQVLVYASEDGKLKVDVRLEQDTVWLTQQQMADLFQSSKQNIGQHLKNIFEDGELVETSVVKNFFTTAADGKKYQTNHYNLDAIISVGYRVKSVVATRFRIWATIKNAFNWQTPQAENLKKRLNNCRHHRNEKREGKSENHR